ncbi:MAG: RDD family protein [Acidobacteria bacterium]|nr:RDD family protein [Acidobacteriota bacterium]
MRRVGTAVADPPAHEASAVGEAVSTASVQTQTKHEVVPEKRVLDLDWNEEDDNFDLDTTKDGYLDYSEYRASEDVNTATDSPLQVEFQFREASIRQRFVAGVVDVSLVLFACVPFAALIELNNVDLLDARVQMIMASVIALVHFLYTSLLLAIGGQTVGMMMTGIIAVDCENMDLPTFWGALRRSFGFVLSALPLFVGYFWPLIDRQHRSLSDIISGTSLKSAFEEYPSARVPWLYRPVG